MSFIETLANITKAYHNFHNNDNDKYNLIDKEMKSDAIQNIVNLSVFDIIYKKSSIEALIKQTGLMVAEMLINYTRDYKSKEFMINYCIAMLFKHNKYEGATKMTYEYNYNIGNVFNYMQESNTDINILKTVFSKYNEELNTECDRKWLMNNIGKYNNIEILKHVEKYYDIDDTDIYFILMGTIDKNNFHNFINTIKYVFENYDFYYDIIQMFYLIRELYYLEYDDAVIYVMTKLVENKGINYVDDFLNNPEMDNHLRNNLIDYFIKVFDDYLIPKAQKNIIEILPLIKNNQLFESIINNKNLLNICEDDKIRINNIRLAIKFI